MNKTELIKLLAKETKTTQKESKKSVDTLLKIITSAMEHGEKITISGFGKFWAKYKKPIKNTYSCMGNLPKFVPKFCASKSLKQRFLGIFG